MQSFQDYHPTTTSPYEVLAHLFDRILAGKISTFEELRRYAAPLPDSTATTAVLGRAFELIRQLSWGLFKTVNPEQFPALWRLVVIPDKKYGFAGDLKRTIQSQDICLGIIDIHGYTKFCERNRHNMTMLDYLDRVIFDDVPRIAAQAGVVTQRAHGDEILIVGASVADVLKATLLVMNFLSKDLRKKVAPSIPQASDLVFLPDFQISAGLSGGQKYASLIVTREGELSGNLVNTAARLQSRANRISPELNKILLSSHAYHRVKERVDSGALELPYRIGFFNTGLVEFKGVSLPVFEVVFTEREAYRFTYQPQMEELYLSLRKKMWRSKIFEDALELALVLSKNLPEVEAPERIELQTKVRATGDLLRDEKFEEAVDSLDSVVRHLGSLKSADGLAVEYLRRIQESYSSILQTFLESLDREVEENKEALFAAKERQNLELISKYQSVFETTRKNARARIRNQRATWYRVAEEAAESLDVRIKSLK